MTDLERLDEALDDASVYGSDQWQYDIDLILEAARAYRDLMVTGLHVEHEETGRFVLNEETAEYDTVAKRRYRYLTNWIDE